MHTAAILRMGVDRAGKFLVTASVDNTVRVWELESGKLIRVLRVPIGFSKEGKLSAVAISRDGNTIATGGPSSVDFPYQTVYVFDRESGKLTHRLSGFTSPVNHLVFSDDGALLAAMLGPPEGVFLWRTRDWAEVGRGSDLAGSLGADFDISGRLVTTCVDGILRLYDSNLILLKQQPAPGGKLPFFARFSPDATKLAVGYLDTSRVDVLSAETLGLLFTVNTADVRNGGLGVVAWSQDGKTLYAGGTFQYNGSNIICSWSDPEHGTDVQTPVSTNTIFDIVPLASGAVAFCAADPIWGVLDRNHQKLRSEVGGIIDFRRSAYNLLTDERGDTVSFIPGLFQPPLTFSISERNLTTNTPPGKTLRQPSISAPGIAVTNFPGSDKPLLNSTPINLGSGDRALSLAVARDAKRLLLGSDNLLRLFDPNGQLLPGGAVIAPGATWAVNLTADNRFALAAYADGTIRWYSLAAGLQEVLAFFPHADGKRWVMWTPSGYYDCSPGAEDLIGWHVNNGRGNAADFFPVGQFRSTFYRPDVIAKVLQTGDELRALSLANEQAGRKVERADLNRILPPVVDVVSPLDNSIISGTEVTVRFRVRRPSGEPVTNFRALVDGRPAVATKEITQQGTEAEEREVRVTVPPRDSEVSIIAENRFASSVPGTIRLKWAGTKVTSSKPIPKPTLYILAIGVSRYANEKYNLQFADKDARDFVNAMMAQKGLQYRDVLIYHDQAVTNESANKVEIEKGLEWIRQKPTQGDVAMVFFSGHGLNDQDNNYFFCPYEIDPGSLFSTGVPFSDLRNALAAVKGKVLFFVDSCHSGNSLGTGWRRDMNILVNELSSAKYGVLVISASSSAELAYEVPDLSLGMRAAPPWNNGAFTKAVIEGINGAAESRPSPGRITYASLADYVDARVIELTNNHQHAGFTVQGGGNLSIALKK